MAPLRIIVGDTHVPFVEGGAELHVRSLVHQLNARGHETELFAVPFNPQAKAELLSQAQAWRLLNFRETNGRPVDLFIATRFPSYFAKHPRKTAWIIHQHRAAYELAGTVYSDFQHTAGDVAIRKTLIEADTAMLRECRRVFANAGNTAARLKKYNGIDAEPLYHPPPLADRINSGPYGDYVLSVGRLEAIKRVEIAVRALQFAKKEIRLVIVGEGSHRPEIERLVAETGVADRVRLAGRATEEELLELYQKALAVVYPPYDEDFGYVTLEAFLAAKPVLTARDSGGPLEFVVDGVNGFVCDPDPQSFGAAINRLGADPALAARFGAAGYERARSISWDGVIEKLLAA